MPMSNADGNPWPRSRVLVTGGAGFIGSALVWELNRRGCSNVVIADSAPQADRSRNLRALHFTDYLEPFAALTALQSGALGKFDFIFHLGACSSTLENDFHFLRRNNFGFSRDLAAVALANKTRFLYASSAATYGDGSAGMDDSDPRLLKNLRPLNFYATSKQMMDLHAWQYGWLDRLVALKYFNVFGPNETYKANMQSLVCKSFAQLMRTGSIQLFKSYRPEYRDGDQKRDFLYVKDAAAMTLHLAASPAANGIFNLGSGEAHSWNELARALFAALGREPRIEYIEMPDAIRPMYQYFTQANISKLRAAGYSAPITPLDEAVRDYVVNYLVPGASLGDETLAVAS